jgi:hypothetical protein
MFLRHLQLDIADSFVFVTAKFNQRAQWQISMLIDQLSHKPSKQITDTKKLIIVHNLIDVDNAEALNARIQEVEDCYGKNWRRQQEKVFVDDKPTSCYYFQSSRTNHLFLVRHPEENDGNNWRYIHNLGVIEILKVLMKGNNPRMFHLVDEFLVHASKELPKYIREWDETYAIKANEQQHRIEVYRRELSSDDPAPTPTPATTAANTTANTAAKTAATPTKPSVVVPGSSPTTPTPTTAATSPTTANTIPPRFTLHDLHFTDLGEVISEAQSRLEGNVYTCGPDPTKKWNGEHCLQVAVPGLSDISAVRLKYEGWNTIAVTVTVPQLSVQPLDESKLKTTYEIPRRELRFSRAYFLHTFPKDQPFRRPIASDGKYMTLEAGVLTVHLARENLIEETNNNTKPNS